MTDVAPRGTKRKRHEHKEEDISVKISGKLHHNVKEVRKAAKKAKTFETQRLVKRLKDLRSKEGNAPEILECEAQLEVLKSIDHEPIANTALTTKIKKDRLLSEDVNAQAAVAKELSTNLLNPATAGSPLAKVQGRLLSSKVLAAEIALVVEDLRAALQPKAKEPAVPDAEEELAEHPKKAKKAESKTAKERETEGVSDTDDMAGEEDEAGWESGTVDGDGDADDWESGSVPSATRHEDDASSDDDSANEDEDSEALSAAEDPKPSSRVVRKEPVSAKTKAEAPSKASKAKESTFLPSLSVGFIRGDSDSEFSDTEDKTADLRKNRRGQRARRAIWEKKFGKNANHTKKLREMEVSGRGRNQRHGAGARAPNRTTLNHGSSALPRRGKPDGTSQQHHQPADIGWGQRTSATTTAAGPNIPAKPAAPYAGAQQHRHTEERPLHPSWEAKKKQKEKLSAGILPAQGTKIKF